MLRLIIESAAIGAVISLGANGVLGLVGFHVDPAIIGAMAGVGAGIYASRVSVRRKGPKKGS